MKSHHLDEVSSGLPYLKDQRHDNTSVRLLSLSDFLSALWFLLKT